jgi:hypothetical protein
VPTEKGMKHGKLLPEHTANQPGSVPSRKIVSENPSIVVEVPSETVCVGGAGPSSTTLNIRLAVGGDTVRVTPQNKSFEALPDDTSIFAM